MEVFEDFKTPPLPTEFTYFEDTKDLIVEYSGEQEARVFLNVPKETYEVVAHPDNKRRNADWLRIQDNYTSISLEEYLGTK